MALNDIIRHMGQPDPAASTQSRNTLNDKEREYAERIFFEKHLKECNPGMSEEKIKGRMEKSVATAKMLYKTIYGEQS